MQDRYQFTQESEQQLIKHYAELSADIKKLKTSALSLEDTIHLINHLIYDDGLLADKQLAWSPNEPDLVSWNIGCGSRWVDIKAAENADASKVVIYNPTYDSIKKKYNVPAHNARMQCVAAVLEVLNSKGIKTVNLQEAPGADNDTLYSLKDSNNQSIITKNKESKDSGHISTAIYGSLLPPEKYNSKQRELIDTINAIAASSDFKINPSEYQIGFLANGKCMVDVHLDYCGKGMKTTDSQFPAFIKTRVDFLNELRKLDVVIAGDTNRREDEMVKYFSSAGSLNGVSTFGTSGCDTDDVIIAPNTTNQYKHYAPDETRSDKRVNILENAIETAKTTIATFITALFKPHDPNPETLKVRQDLSERITKQLRLNSEVSVNKGASDENTLKIAFTDPLAAEKFFKDAANFGAQVTISGCMGHKAEKHPMDKNGLIGTKGKFIYIVRFKDSTQAINFMKKDIPDADELVNMIMTKQPTVMLSKEQNH